MPKTPEEEALIGRIRINSRHGNKELADEQRRELRMISAERYINALVEKAPPLTDEQLAHLANLLQRKRGGE